MADTVLITGPSSGIGRELARCFAAGGDDLVLVARDEARLRELAEELEKAHGTKSRVIAADLSRPTAGAEVTDPLERDGVEVDVLVNNAGFGASGTIAELPLERQLDMLQVNVVALTELTRRLVPGMVARRRGGVLNVASLAAYQAGPNQAVYCATKAYVLSFTEALAEELRGTGVRVTCLAPGATRTEFADRAGLRSTMLFRLGAMDAAPVARAGFNAFRRGRVIAMPGIGNRALAFSTRFAPRVVARRIAGRLQA